MKLSYATQIVKMLSGLGSKNGTVNPDKTHNVGNMLGEAFMWDAVEKYAAARSRKAWDQLASEGFVEKEKLSPGDHVLAESPTFQCTAKVSEKVRRFDPQVLAEAMKKRWKVAVPTALEMIEEAKVPTKSQVTLRVIERE